MTTFIDKIDTKHKEFNEHYLKHRLTAEFYSTISPSVSRIFMTNAYDMARNGPVDDKNKLDIRACEYCGSVLTPENTKIRLKSKRKQPVKLLRKLQEKSNNNVSLGKQQLALLERSKNSGVTKIVRCLTCNKTNNMALGNKDKRITKKIIAKINEPTKKKKKKKKLKNGSDHGILNPKGVSQSSKVSPKQLNKVKKAPAKVTKVTRSHQPSPANNKKRKIGVGGSHNILKNMLKQKQEEKKHRSNALGDFLSSI